LTRPRNSSSSRAWAVGSAICAPPFYWFDRVRAAGPKRGADANPLLGQKVRHPNYGVGTIVGVEGDDEDRRVSVSFPGRGTKKFVERYAQLETDVASGQCCAAALSMYIEAARKPSDSSSHGFDWRVTSGVTPLTLQGH